MDACTYTHSVIHKENNQRIEKKRQISAREYVKLLENSDKGMKVLKKRRQCFLYKNTCMILDVYQNVDGSPTFLRILREEGAKVPDVPPIFVVVKDVTDAEEYSNFLMASKEWKMPEEDKKNTDPDAHPEDRKDALAKIKHSPEVKRDFITDREIPPMVPLHI